MLRKSIITASDENVQDPVPDLDVHIPIKEAEVLEGGTGDVEKKGEMVEDDEIIVALQSSSISSSSLVVQDVVVAVDSKLSTNPEGNLS